MSADRPSKIARLFGVPRDVVDEALARAEAEGRDVIDVLLDEGALGEGALAEAPTRTPAAPPLARGATETPGGDTVAAGVRDGLCPLPEELPGGLRIVRGLGEGGMGRVYLARDEGLARDVVVKTLAPGLRSKPEFAARFLREARAAARLAHPNIVTVHAVREHEGLPYLVMEYLDGEDLAALLAREGPLPLRRALELVRQAAAGVAAAHREGIVHRDLKPANLLLTRAGRVKVLDFGTAYLSGEGGELTRTGQLVGTIPFMPPEQAEGREVDPRADVYSLGATLFCLLAGHPPYPGPSVLSVLRALISPKPPPSLAEQRPDLPEPVVALVDRCLAKDLRERYSDAGALEEALGVALASLGPADAGPSADGGVPDEGRSGPPVDSRASTVAAPPTEESAVAGAGATAAAASAAHSPPSPAPPAAPALPTEHPQRAAGPRPQRLGRFALGVAALVGALGAWAAPHVARRARLREVERAPRAEQFARAEAFLARYPDDPEGLALLGTWRTWSEVHTEPRPRARAAHALCAAPRGGLLLFGGSQALAGPEGGSQEAARALGDTWVWRQGAWQQRRPAAEPSPRRAHALAYDAARRRVVLFGGENAADQDLGDTWEWDGANWVRCAPTRSPPPRSWHAMAYDAARRRVVLFGGAQGEARDLDDTWTWNGREWRQVPVEGPPSRHDHAMTYDAARQRVILFGGLSLRGKPPLRGDTWSFDGSAWRREEPPTSPPPLAAARLAADPERRTVVLFGGLAGDGSVSDRTFEWDGVRWQARRPAKSPRGRAAAALAYDAQARRVFLFGGAGSVAGDDVLDDFWGYGRPVGAVGAPVGGGR
ncbi:MAG: hypothetical protein D6731_12585 [Planctomycetota bacterium]|nr:MAG: hypothetical protein D6731_12585 [Planctomycetota bacterium]